MQTQHAQHHVPSPVPVRVDVRLCGGIPRKDMKDQLFIKDNGARCSLSAMTSRSETSLTISCLAAANGPTSDCSTHRTIAVCDALSGLAMHNHQNITAITNNNDKNNNNMLQTIESNIQKSTPLAPLMDVPSWAVPARGESRLEPVCDSVGRQAAVDLTKRACFRVGRSPNCDVQLHHATSSRRHAMLFHHSNGSCYVVDCGSAHGTFVNGQRISPPANGGAVIPNKVRRGALIRFGGPGAPTYIMKSFSFRLKDIDATTESPDEGKLVRRNTRINALGKTASEAVQANITDKVLQALDVCRKRSFDSVDSSVTLDEPIMKRVRCSSPPLSPEEPLRLVSPDLPSMSAKRRVTFSTDPPQLFFPAMVTPEVLSSEEDNDSI